MSMLKISSAILALSVAATAQVGTSYTFSQTLGAYAPISGGTLLGTPTPAATMDDDTYAVPLPFYFFYDGHTHYEVQIQTNGWLGFGAAALATSYAPLSSTLVTPGIISAFGRDLQGGYLTSADRTMGSFAINVSKVGPLQVGDSVVGTGIPAGATIVAITGTTITLSVAAASTGVNGYLTGYGAWSEMRYETLGAAPNQVFVVQWSNFRRYGTLLTTSKDMRLNFQIRLYEGTNRIEAVYGFCYPGTGTTTTTLHQVGLRGPTNTFPANINNRENTKGVNDDWSMSLPGTTNARGMLFNAVAPANVIPTGLTYSWDPPPFSVAYWGTSGVGCYSEPNASFYQFFADAALAAPALTGQSMTMRLVGTEYVANWGGGTYVAPSAAATVLPLNDDSEVTVTPSTPFAGPTGALSSFRVHSNGLIVLSSTAQTFPGSQSFHPQPWAFLEASQPAIWSWHDYNPAEAGSGAVKYEEALDANSDLIGYVTWDGVESRSTPAAQNPSTMQFQLTLTGANAGRVVIVWQSIDSNTTSPWGSAHLVGFSPGGWSLNPGSVTLATALPITTSPDVVGLWLTPDVRPTLGTTVTYTTSNISAASPVSFQLISLVQIPGVDLGFMGAPGCLQFVDLGYSVSHLMFGAPTASFSLAVPASFALAGLDLYFQSASMDPAANALGVRTSNLIWNRTGFY